MKQYTDCSFVNTSAEFDKKLAQAPGNKFPREAIQNGIEAYLCSQKTFPDKKISIFRVNPDYFFPFSEALRAEGFDQQLCAKLAYHNFGDGMDAKKLRNILNGASSGEEKKMATTDNHGEGATITGLASNQGMGTVWISCRDGKVSLAWLRVYRNIEGLRVPAKYNFFDDAKAARANSGFEDIIDITNLPCFKKEMLAHDHNTLLDTSSDWTLVIAMGDNPGQNTAERPYKSDVKESGGWLQKDIVNRYFRFPPEISVRIMGGCGQNRLPNSYFTVKSYEEEINDAINDDITKNTGFKFEWITDDDTGTRIGYMYEPDSEGTKGRRILAVGKGNPSYSAIIYKDECYSTKSDTRDHASWKSVAPACGITVSNENFKILVELRSSKDIVPSGWRKDITFESDPGRTSIDFATSLASGERICDMVKRLMPEWVKDKLKELDNSLVDNSNRQADFQKKLEEMLKPQKAEAGNIFGTLFGGGAGSGKGGGKGSKNGDGNGSGNGNGSGGTGRKRRPFSWQTGQEVTVAPQFPIIKTVVDEIEWETKGGTYDLENKAAWYDIENEILWINGLYDVVERHSSMLLEKYPSDSSSIEDSARSLARSAMEDRICWHILNGLAKKAISSGWNTDSINESWTPSALTVGAADIIYANADEYYTKMREERTKLENKVY